MYTEESSVQVVRLHELRALRVVLTCIIAVSILGITSCDVSKAERQLAITAVMPWVQLIDTGQYEEAWKRASAYFKGATTMTHWNELMRSYREPLGKVLSRSPKSVRRKSTLPGAPDANYVVIKFETIFERKREAVETVVAIAEADRRLVVTGYYVE